MATTVALDWLANELAGRGKIDAACRDRMVMHLRSRAAESSYILEGKPAEASVFSRIFSNMEVRGTLYILKDIRE